MPGIGITQDHVSRARCLTRKVAELVKEHDQALDMQRRAAADIARVEPQLRTAQEELTKHLRSMDVAQAANYGWEYRIAAFLVEFQAQEKAAAK